MPDSIPRARGLLFDSVAEAYRAIRPRYPDVLFDDLGALAGLAPGSRVLEIGCGPGTATGDLLARRWVVDAVEPGSEMASVARRSGDGAVLRVVESTFENWDPGSDTYALVFSATAFHWVDPAVRWTKVAAVLEEGGHLALATNHTVRGGSFDELYLASHDLHHRYVPGSADDGPAPSADALEAALAAASHDIGTLWGVAEPRDGGAPAGPSFGPPVLRTYSWERDYSTDAAIGLLSTFSPYLAVPEPDRRAFFAGLAELIDARFGGTVSSRYLSILALSRRAA